MSAFSTILLSVVLFVCAATIIILIIEENGQTKRRTQKDYVVRKYRSRDKMSKDTEVKPVNEFEGFPENPVMGQMHSDGKDRVWVFCDNTWVRLEPVNPVQVLISAGIANLNASATTLEEFALIEKFMQIVETSFNTGGTKVSLTFLETCKKPFKETSCT